MEPADIEEHCRLCGAGPPSHFRVPWQQTGEQDMLVAAVYAVLTTNNYVTGVPRPPPATQAFHALSTRAAGSAHRGSSVGQRGRRPRVGGMFVSWNNQYFYNNMQQCVVLVEVILKALLIVAGSAVNRHLKRFPEVLWTGI